MTDFPGQDIVDQTIKGNIEATVATGDVSLYTPSAGRIARLLGVAAINKIATTGFVLYLKDGTGGPVRLPTLLQAPIPAASATGALVGGIPASLLIGPSNMPPGIDFTTGITVNSGITGTEIMVSVKEY